MSVNNVIHGNGSSCVKMIVYNPETKNMIVALTDGTQYPYYSVDQKTFSQIKRAKSLGGAYNNFLRGKFQGQ